MVEDSIIFIANISIFIVHIFRISLQAFTMCV